MIQAFYFGRDDAQLFGAYHAPPPGGAPACGVLLCYPMGHEYIQAHRAYVQLAERLARRGQPVLRFDYHACGDSPGDARDASIDRWLEDTARGLDELRARASPAAVCIVGCRLGATLATMVAARDGAVDGLVLWDPIVLGRPHVEDLRAQQRRMLQDAHLVPPEATEVQPTEQALGFPLPTSLADELQRLDLRHVVERAARRTLRIQTGPLPGVEDLDALLARTGVDLQRQEIPTAEAWTYNENVDKLIIPHDVLRAIETWCEEQYG